MAAYYNEFEPYAAQWLRNLIEAGLIAHGDVDTRDIRDVRPRELDGYSQCHFFAGIGGWSLALRLAGWPDDQDVWTGSCPCQPFSVAGRQRADKDERHLWPTLAELIAARTPNVFFGEQVSNAIGHDWWDTVSGDLEAFGYQTGAAILSASSVGAPHERKRLYFGAMADRNSVARNARRALHTYESAGWRNADRGRELGAMADANASERRANNAARHDVIRQDAGRPQGSSNIAECSPRYGGVMGNANGARLAERQEQPTRQKFPALERTSGSTWGGEWRQCVDGKFRLFGPGVPLLANGLPRDLAGSLAGFGNAIVPQVAAQFIDAWRECAP